MKANELMIGDWVLFNGNSKKVTSLLVTDLGVDQIYVFGNTCQVATISEYIEPIPLTAEILEKNGFKNYRLSYDNGDYYYHIVLENVKGGMWIEVMSSRNVLHGRKEYCGLINYVHELQHALKLCGIDKTIEL